MEEKIEQVNEKVNQLMKGVDQIKERLDGLSSKRSVTHSRLLRCSGIFVIVCFCFCCYQLYVINNRVLIEGELCLKIVLCIVFLSVFLISAVAFYKTYKIESKEIAAENEFRRRKDMEKFQFDLYKDDNQKRVEFERKKYIYSEVKDIANELSKVEMATDERINELKGHIDKLEKDRVSNFVVELKNNL
jgi:autotransporter adhesin